MLVTYGHTPYQPTTFIADPVMLDLNLSSLGGETTSTPVSKYSSDFYSDEVD
jgi:hypothetical protein